MSCLDWKLPFYRINYGQGQVSDPIRTRREAIQALKREDRYAWIDIRDVDGWEASRLTTKEREELSHD